MYEPFGRGDAVTFNKASERNFTILVAPPEFSVANAAEIPEFERARNDGIRFIRKEVTPTEVNLLFSPPHTPEYNGAIEAGSVP